MAKKSAGTDRQPWEVDFLRVDLDAETKRSLQAWDIACQESMAVIEDAVLAGSKFSVNFDLRGDCCIASLTSPKTTGPGRQLCLSGRGPGFSEAIRALAYKFKFVLDCSWSGAVETSAARDSWG